MIKQRILVIDDDLDVCRSIREAMQDMYTDVCYTMSIVETLEALAKYDYRLVIMDIRLSEADGMEVLRIIRRMKNIPILILSAKLGTAEKAEIFREGATAYLEKPLDITVCTAQADSLIQLYTEAQAENRTYQPLIFGTELVIDPIYRHVIIDGEQLKLTRTEFDLLFCLAQRPGQIWSRSQLYQNVWNNGLDIGGDNTVRAHIGNLRKKLADVGKNYVQNSRGFGYRFVPPVSVHSK